MDGLDALAQALGITDRKAADWHCLAKVSAVNPDGSLTCYLAGSLSPTTVEAYCSAQPGDVVCVLISKGKARAIARKGGTAGPAVLYDDATGTGGTVTLARSAANYEHMRIYFKKNGDAGTYSSVEVYQPNGKNVALLVYNPFSTSRSQIVARAVTISGTTISKYSGEGSYPESYWNFGETGGKASSPSIYITRVEAW